ncbi:phtf [Carabus blaptoides fortunei]
MGVQDILCWYQKKIGTYDKQQWEKTIEQRILHGLTHIHPMKTKQPKTEFIDLDLVRGSSFPKAKPKHGIVTVTRLATLRLFFLPLYSRWWVEQTSARVFALLLILYILQLINIGVYFHNVHKQTDTALERVSSSEIIVPICMMFILSIIHSQIVSTHTGPEKLPQRPRSRRSKLRRRRMNYSRCSRNLTNSDIKSSTESSLDGAQLQSAARDGVYKTLRKMSSDLRNRNNAWDEEQSNANVPAKVNPNSSTTLNVKFNLTETERNSSENDAPAAVPMEDDGFESFNGYGSSENGEETVTETIVDKQEGPMAEENTVDGPATTSSNEVESVKRRDNDFSSGEQSDMESDGEARRVHSQDTDDAIPLLVETNTSTTEYLGITTNSEECSYSSEYDESDSQNELVNNDNWDYDLAPTVILSPSCSPSDRVSCTIWENRDIKKADLSVLDISSAIIARVESMPETPDYIYSGTVLSILLAFLPPICRLFESASETNISREVQLSVFELWSFMADKFSGSGLTAVIDAAFGNYLWERTIMFIGLIERCSLACLFFFLLAVAERTFKQRFLYAKLFSHLTSSRRARKSELPHFRLNKVRNIKTWLSVRSYLKRRGPQRSVDVIVSTAFIITLLLLSFISMELLKDSVTVHSQYNFEAVLWCLGLGVFLLRFMTLGTKINRKNRNLSVLITEQINLYLQIEQKPHKKEKLMVANSVLKLAADLLKELESPFKISGLSANPYLYNITKVVILSALSGVLSEMLGFKVKLTKINIK